MKPRAAPAAPRIVVHATSLALLDAAKPFGGAGDGAVLLLGDAGAGKSDVALRLIASGAKLVADDQTQLFIENGRVFADAPTALTGMIEVRGLGILRIERAPASPVILAVHLGEGSGARLPEPDFYALPPALQADVKVPLVKFDAHEASTPAKIAAAAAGFVHGAIVAGDVPPSDAPFL